MIKIFEVGTTEFKTNGLGQIVPIKCEETKKEGLNDWYIDVELSLVHKGLIEANRIVTVMTKEKGAQAFVIENPQFDKKIKFTANHIVFTGSNYLLDDVRPTDLSPQKYLDYINSNTDIKSPFVLSTNVDGEVATNYFIRKTLLEAVVTASDTFSADIDVDNFNIKLANDINVKADYKLIYGKDITGLTINEKWDDVVTKILPVGTDGLLLPEVYLESDVDYGTPYTKIVSVDLTTTNDDDEEISEEEQIKELRELAQEYLEQNKEPLVNYVVTADVPQDIGIGYVIPVLHPLVELNTEVISYTYDCLSKKVKTVEFGNYERSAKASMTSFKDSVSADTESLKNVILSDAETFKLAITKEFTSLKSEVQEEMQNATDSCEKVADGLTTLFNTDGSKGYFTFKEKDGVIDEIYIADSSKSEDVKNVVKLTCDGLFVSSSGVSGEFRQLMNLQGEIGGWSVDFEKGFTSSYQLDVPDYTQEDIDLLSSYLDGEIELTDDEYGRLDVMQSGLIEDSHLDYMNRVISGELPLVQERESIIQPGSTSTMVEKIAWGSDVIVNEGSIGSMSVSSMKSIDRRIRQLANKIEQVEELKGE